MTNHPLRFTRASQPSSQTTLGSRILAALAMLLLVPAVSYALFRSPQAQLHPAFHALSRAGRPGVLPAQSAPVTRLYEAANAERRKQIAEDSARLLQLANDLSVEVAKTDKDTLSVSVIRKANEIEKLAHKVKENMRFTVGPY